MFELRAAPHSVLHAGLVVIAKNAGADLLRLAYIRMALLEYRRRGATAQVRLDLRIASIGLGD